MEQSIQHIPDIVALRYQQFMQTNPSLSLSASMDSDETTKDSQSLMSMSTSPSHPGPASHTTPDSQSTPFTQAIPAAPPAPAAQPTPNIQTTPTHSTRSSNPSMYRSPPPPLTIPPIAPGLVPPYATFSPQFVPSAYLVPVPHPHPHASYYTPTSSFHPMHMTPYPNNYNNYNAYTLPV
ncbi:hypothetical protein EON65_46745, partial [archaeon]